MKGEQTFSTLRWLFHFSIDYILLLFYSLPAGGRGSFVPFQLHPLVAEQCITHKVNMLTSSYVSPQLQVSIDEGERREGGRWEGEEREGGREEGGREEGGREEGGRREKIGREKRGSEGRESEGRE